MFPRGINPNSSGVNPGWPLGINPQAVALIVGCVSLNLLPAPAVAFSFYQDSVIFSFQAGDRISFEWLPLMWAIAFSPSELVDLEFFMQQLEVQIDVIDRC